MAQICIPLPPLDEPRAVEVTLTIDGIPQTYHYRVESLLWADYDPLPKVNALQMYLDQHDPEWHLAALGVPSEERIPVLFRYRPRPLVQEEAPAAV